MKNILLGLCLFVSTSIFSYNYQQSKPYNFNPDSYSYYDEWGRLQGTAKENWKGDVGYYDSWGRLQGTAKENYKGDVEYYDSWGRKQGTVKKNNGFGY